MLTRRATLVALAVILAAAPVSAEAPKRDHDITVDDYFTLDSIRQSATSPAGKYVAYTLGRWQESTNDRKTDLWVIKTEAKAVKRLTFDRVGAAFPRWSPDGKTVYYLARHKREGEKQPPYDGAAQVWRIGCEGDSPLAVTRIAGGVEAFDLSPDGQQLYYQVSAEKLEGDFKDLKARFKGIEYAAASTSRRRSGGST